jgi:hypothetical protein
VIRHIRIRTARTMFSAGLDLFGNYLMILFIDVMSDNNSGKVYRGCEYYLLVAYFTVISVAQAVTCGVD